MTDTTGTENPLVQSFFWGDATQGLTLDQLKARRAVAAAMASRSRPYPTTVGQGLTALGEGLGQGLYERNLGIAEARQRALDVKEYERSQKPTEAKPPADAAGSAAAGAFGLGSPSTNAAVADSGPDVKDEMASTILAKQGVLPGSAPLERTRMAALDTGTMSDAGSPGLTYGGASAAGPGASMMEPPTTAPPAPTAPSIAANAAAQQPAGPAGTPASGVVGGGPGSAGPPPPVGTAGVAGAVLAQAGAGAPVPRPMPAPPPPPAPAPAPPPRPAAPLPARGLPVDPGPDLGPGGARIDPSQPPPKTPPPPQRVDTPAMIQNRAVRNDPNMIGRRSEFVEQRMDKEFELMKEARDKQFDRDTENWQKVRDYNLEWDKAHREHVIKAPGEQTKQQQEQAKVNDLIRWGSPERKKSAEEAADKSGDAARSWAGALPQIYKAMDLVKQDKVLGGFLAGDVGLGRTGSWLDLPVGSPKLMGSKLATEFGFGDYSRPIGKSGPPRTYKEEVAATEEYQGLLRGIVAANLKAYGGNPSTADLRAAEAQYGLSLGLDNESKLRILNNIKNEYLDKIKEHHSRLSKEFNVPAQDRATLEKNQVEVQHDPSDVEQLRAALRSGASEANVNETINRFDRVYGPGEARKALMTER